MRFLNLNGQSVWSNLGALVYDVIAAAAAISMAIWYSFGLQLPDVLERRPGFLVWTTIVFACIAAGVYLAQGQHKNAWRYTSIRELVTLIRSTVVTLLFFVPFVFLLSRAEDVPRSSLILSAVFMIALLTAPRLAARLLFRGEVKTYAEQNAFRHRLPALVLGTGPMAQKFLRAINQDATAVYQIFGAVAIEDAPTRAWDIAEDLKQVPILGSLKHLSQILKQVRNDGVNIRHLILCDRALEPTVANTILVSGSEFGMTLLRVRMDDDSLRDRTVHTPSEVLPFLLEDLLRPVQTSEVPQALIDGLAGQTILITGAGGSIGSELARCIASYGPGRLVLLEKSEFNLYSIDEELNASHPDVPRETILCNVRDGAAIDRWFQQIQPHFVFHAAALKHVPMVEAHPLEGIMTNVEGTRIVADACIKHGVKAMILVSSDKAVHPRSVMGATKRIAESYCQALEMRQLRDAGDTCRFITVRFGNVLWSTGSVVTRFRKQLAEGLPLTVTHPEITRFFMTIGEAVRLILTAWHLALTREGEKGGVYVLDMGAPIKILDLAKTMIMLAGKRPAIDVQIQYVGLRPGEKLSEVLLHETETLVPTGQPGILMGHPRPVDLQLLRRDIETLTGHARNGDTAAALKALQHCVPDYVHESPLAPLPNAIRETKTQ